MINSNPETVSTDYDTSDMLFFEPLTHEDVLNICERLNGQPFASATTTSESPLAADSSAADNRRSKIENLKSEISNPQSEIRNPQSQTEGLLYGVIVQFG